MKIALPKLEKIIKRILGKEYSAEEVKLIKEPMTFAELIGKPSHGIIRLGAKNYGAFVTHRLGKPKIREKSPFSAVVEGKNNCGFLVAGLGLQEVIKRAQKTGMAIVGTRQSFNTTGTLTYYAHAIAKEGLIGIMMTHCSPFVAPFNSQSALFGTNPIAFAFPLKPYPLIFDMATSAISYGDIMKYAAEKRQLPKGVAVDQKGKPTTDPEAAKSGSILPFDGSYKSSGLGMVVELLAGLLTGSSFLGQHPKNGWGNLLIALKPDLFLPPSKYKKNVQEFVSFLYSAKTRDGKPMRLPSEHSMKTYHENLKKKSVEINDSILQNVLSENGLKLADF